MNVESKFIIKLIAKIAYIWIRYIKYDVEYWQRLTMKLLVLPWQGVKPVFDDWPGGHNVSFPVTKLVYSVMIQKLWNVPMVEV